MMKDEKNKNKNILKKCIMYMEAFLCQAWSLQRIFSGISSFFNALAVILFFQAK